MSRWMLCTGPLSSPRKQRCCELRETLASGTAEKSNRGKRKPRELRFGHQSLDMGYNNAQPVMSSFSQPLNDSNITYVTQMF